MEIQQASKASWVQAHHVVLEKYVNCTTAAVELVNKTVAAELPKECQDLPWDDCQGCEDDEGSADPELAKECRYCGCQVGGGPNQRVTTQHYH